MRENAKEAYIYIYELLDKYSTQDYIKMAVKEYLCYSDALLKDKMFSDELFDIKRTLEGKPYFPNCKEIGFSVSHSGKYIVCAFSQGNIGVDIEQKGRWADESDEEYSNRLIKIAERFFHPDEASVVKINPKTRFYEVFTAKESYVKFTGTGFDEKLGENFVLPEDKNFPSCHKCLESVYWKAGMANYWQSIIDQNYVICVCAEQMISPHVVFCSVE